MIVKQTILQLLELEDNSIISVVGCGGKTSLINSIAFSADGKKVLVSPTTKILPMIDAMSCNTLDDCKNHAAKIGVQCLGVLNPQNGKLESLPINVLENIVSDYDYSLLEADGSKNLPCKGWKDYEPVIPNYTTHTIGVVTLNAVGKSATTENVHNLDEFLELTGLSVGETITQQAVIDMICRRDGMFKNAVGKLILLVNQIEDNDQTSSAIHFIKKIARAYPNKFHCLACGSAKQNKWQEVI